jgi:hypothetical protein
MNRRAVLLFVRQWAADSEVRIEHEPDIPLVRSMTQMFGKCLDRVTDNNDPFRLGRPPVAAPPVGSSVWVEFEGGNIDMPTWGGCFWEVGELPVEATSSSSLVFNPTRSANDTAAGVSLARSR